MRLRFIIICVLVSLLQSHLSIAYAQPLTPPQQTVPDDFTWVPWLAAGERIWGAVIRIEPKLKDVIGDGRNVAVAVEDVNFDKQKDIILYFWGPDQCGADGCSYLILSNDGRIKRAFTARMIKRQGFGLNVDGRYYRL